MNYLTLNSKDLRTAAKEAGVKEYWLKNKAQLLAGIVEVKGWSAEPEEIQQFLLAGHEIQAAAPSVQPVPRRPHRTPVKAPVVVTEPAAEPVVEKKPKTTKLMKLEVLGTTTLAQICEDNDIKQTVARRRLRNSGMTKPEGGWSWGHGELTEAILNIIKGIK